MSIYPQPTYLHQIFINSDNNLPEFSEAIQENIALLKQHYPNSEYKLWLQDDIEKLLGTTFPPEVLESFKLLVPYAYKADLARLCILYIYGGLYLDIGKRLLKPIELPENFGIFAVQDIQNSAPIWTSVLNSIIWTHAYREELQIAINIIVDNCKNKYYGENALCPTGPVVLGLAIIKAMAKKEKLFPNDFWIGRSEPNHFYTPTNQLVVKSISGISSDKELAKKLKGNNYNDYWFNKQVYGEQGREYKFTDGQVYLGDGGILTNEGILPITKEKGLLSYGPYINVSSGKYLLHIQTSSSAFGKLVIEITADAGSSIILTKTLLITSTNVATIEIEFSQEFNQVEFRVYSLESFYGVFIGYTLELISN